MTNLTNEQLTEIIANDPRVEELAARLEQIEQKEQAINEALKNVDADLSTIHNDEIRKILIEMQHDVKREEQKLTRDEERRLFEDAGAVHVFNSAVEDYEFGELPDNHESGYRYFYSYPKIRTVYSDEKVFRFTNDSAEYSAALSKTLKEFGTGDSENDEFVTYF